MIRSCETQLACSEVCVRRDFFSFNCSVPAWHKPIDKFSVLPSTIPLKNTFWVLNTNSFYNYKILNACFPEIYLHDLSESYFDSRTKTLQIRSALPPSVFYLHTISYYLSHQRTLNEMQTYHENTLPLTMNATLALFKWPHTYHFLVVLLLTVFHRSLN